MHRDLLTYKAGLLTREITMSGTAAKPYTNTQLEEAISEITGHDWRTNYQGLEHVMAEAFRTKRDDYFTDVIRIMDAYFQMQIAPERKLVEATARYQALCNDMGLTQESTSPSGP
jgi:hypothetical protein